MSEIHATVPFKSIELQAVVTRADGTIEDLGTVAYNHRNPLYRLIFRVKQALRGRN